MASQTGKFNGTSQLRPPKGPAKCGLIRRYSCFEAGPLSHRGRTGGIISDGDLNCEGIHHIRLHHTC